MREKLNLNWMERATLMSKAEFEWAMDQSPPYEVAKMYSDEKAPVVIKNPLDRAWINYGAAQRGSMAWKIPCPNKKHREYLLSFDAPKDLVSTKGYPIVVCPAGTIRLQDKHTVYYVGVCEGCGVVYWLIEGDEK